MVHVRSSFLQLAILLFGGGDFVGSPDVVPLPEDPVVTQVAPAECLFYSSWTGKKKASPEATSSTEQLFSDPKFLDYLKQVNETLHNLVEQQRVGLEVSEELVDAALFFLKHLHTHAGSVYLSEVDAKWNAAPKFSGGLVLRVEDDDQEAFMENLQVVLNLLPKEMQSVVHLESNPYSRIDLGNGAPLVHWVLNGNYFVVGIGDGKIEKMAKRLDGPVPSWLVEAKLAVATPRPASFVHLDIQRLFSTIENSMRPRDIAEFTGTLEAFGLDGIERFSFGGGLDDRGTVHRGHLKLAGELRGMLKLVDSKPLVAADFGPISSKSPVAVVFQLDPAEMLTAFLDSCEHDSAPESLARTATQWRRNIQRVQQRMGVDLHQEFLGSIGDTWRLFAQPGPRGLINGWTISVDLSDSDKFAEAHEVLLGDFRAKVGNEGVEIVSQENDQADIHSAHIRGFPLVPTWAIFEDRLWITTSAMAAEELLSSPAPEKTLAEAEHVRPFLEEGKRTIKLVHLDVAAVAKLVLPLVGMQLNAVPAGMLPVDASILPPLEVLTKHLRPTVIAVERTDAGIEITHHGTLPTVNPGQVAPLLVGGALPAAGAARGAARRAQSQYRQKQIGLAMHNFHSARNAFPAGYSADGEGKPLLSWRVHILPYIEEQGLYNQFHLDEPWDSEHNKELIEQMPDVYRSPRSKAEAGKTTYLGVGGADGVFVRPADGNNLGTGMAGIRDGSSNTAMTVEVTDKRAVTWTRPGDFAPDKDNPKKGLFVSPGGTMSIGFTDGSVQSIHKDLDSEGIMGFFTKAGGEVDIRQQ